ncbi:MAG: hypothetical protein CVT48_06690 [Thermoplasmata archaeon HGW-Thermoplasmata-1]|nr:MAG: hypothetical protein CVT48_06690 [Thermoplasmata archaeon HGW-Thermoplasmata-1]
MTLATKGVFVRAITKRPKTILLVFVAASILLGCFAPGVKIDSNIQSYLPQNSEPMKTLEHISRDWPVDMIVLYVTVDEATNVATLKELDKLERLIDPLYNPAASDIGISRTNSMASMIREMHFRLTGIDDVPDQQEIVDIYLQIIPPEFSSKMVSDDGENAVVFVFAKNGADQAAVLGFVKEETGGLKFDRIKDVVATGIIPLSQDTTNWVADAMAILAPLSFAGVCIVLFIFHRNLKILVIAGVPLLLSLMLTFGLLALLPLSFSPQIAMSASILIALGIAYGLHLANRFSEEKKHRSPNDALAAVINTSGRAVLLSALTTMAGFCSLMIIDLPPVRSFGFGLVIGTFFCYVSSMVAVPCLLLLFDYEKKGRATAWPGLMKVLDHPKKTIVFAVLITLVSMAMLPAVKTDFDVTEMLPDDVPSVGAMMAYSEKFDAGFPGIYAVTGDIMEPRVLQAMDELQGDINAIDGVTAYSIVDFFKYLNNGQIPQTRQHAQLLADNMLSEKQRAAMLDEYRMRAIVFVDMPDMPVKELGERVISVQEVIERHNSGFPGTITGLTGVGAFIHDVVSSLMKDQFVTVSLSIVLVLLCLLVIFRSFGYSFMTLMPLLLVVLWEPLFLVMTGVSISLLSMMIASIVVGVGVDFGVHMTERIKDEIFEGRSGLQAVSEGISKTAPSLVEATFTMVAGIAPVFILGVDSINQFAGLTIIMLAASCGTALLILPPVYGIRYGHWLERWGKKQLEIRKIKELRYRLKEEVRKRIRGG